MRDLAMQVGVAPERILDETTSQNTMQNAMNLSRLMPVGADRRLGLVTCAMHMRRSERVFKRVFPRDTIVPIPVDHAYEPPRLAMETLIPSVDALLTSSSAIHEWIGMAWYVVRHD